MQFKHVLWSASLAGVGVLQSTAEATDRLVPQQYATIQAAIDASMNGDVVQISPGNYAGPIDLRAKAITVRGAVDAVSTVVAGGDSVFRCVTGEGPGTVIERLTITGGTNSNADGQGGGIHIVNSSPTIRDCHIVGNTSAAGGGICCKQGAPIIVDCLIAANTATAGNALGGGIYLSSSSATVTRCLITGNRLSVGVGNGCGGGAGAGLYATGGGTLRVEATTVISNQTSIGASTACNFNQGAGMYLGATNTWVVDCVIRENANSGVGGNVSGIYFESNLVYMQRTKICGNFGTQTFGAYINMGGNVVSATCPIICAGDLNSDGYVDGDDLGRLLSNWGPCTN